MTNALTGKLGYRRRSWETVPGALAPELWCEWYQPGKTGDLERWRSLAGVCQREVVGDYGPDAVPAMACWVCSYGRFRLLESIRAAGWENIAYCDTDSLIVSPAGFERLMKAGIVDAGLLGCLELRSCPSETSIYGVKHYIEDGKTKCAGWARGVCVESADGLAHWYTPAPSVGSGEFESGTVGSRLVPRPHPTPYLHGVVGKDGVVSPHRIERT